MKKAVIAAIAVALLGSGAVFLSSHAQGDADYDGRLRTEKLEISKADGSGTRSFEVEIADTPPAQETGLMFRKEMAENHGMLFEFAGAPRAVSFWMKNTLIPLDMIFVAPGGQIVNIAENAKPGDLTPISSAGPVSGVIEINGGVARKLGIAAGDVVMHPWFSPARESQ